MKTHLNDLFDKLEPEEGNKIDDKIQIEHDPEVDSIIKFIYEGDGEPDSGLLLSEVYPHFEEIYPKKHSSHTITKCISSLPKDILENESIYDYLGFFFAYLIENSNDKKHIISTEHLKFDLPMIGLYNTKNIEIFGDVGYSIGRLMKSGSIEINGNTGQSLGIDMLGGLITVHGDVKREAGIFMKGGKIIIDGNSEGGLGFKGNGGEIYVGGNVLSYLTRCTKIYHKGKRIV